MPIMLHACRYFYSNVVNIMTDWFLCMVGIISALETRGSVCTADAHNADCAFHDVTKTFSSYDTSSNGQSKQNSDTDSCSYNNDLLT